MRFAEYVRRSGAAVAPVDRFARFVVEAGMPAGWEPVRSVPGMRVWCDSDERSSGGFCANVVLTMHRVAAALDEGEVFAMLVDEQLQSVPGCREDRRELVPADDGVGVEGLLALQIPAHEFGAIDSVSRSRIIKYGPETLIAQLTMTALRNSSMNPAGFWLTVRPGAAPGGVGVQMGDAYHDESTPAAEPGERVERPRVTPQRGTITDG